MDLPLVSGRYLSVQFPGGLTGMRDKDAGHAVLKVVTTLTRYVKQIYDSRRDS